jgi:hypothetical protein
MAAGNIGRLDLNLSGRACDLRLCISVLARLWPSLHDDRFAFVSCWQDLGRAFATILTYSSFFSVLVKPWLSLREDHSCSCRRLGKTLVEPLR